MKMFRKDEGFTLVELMVVVLIIGILVAIAIPVFNAARARAEQRSCFANQRSVEGAVETYLADQEGAGVVPADAAALTAALGGTYVKVMPPICKSGGVYGWTQATKVYTCGAGGAFAGHGHFQ